MRNIFTRLFEKKSIEKVAAPEIRIINKQYFVCHYCQYKFEVDLRKIFPMSVPAIGKDYVFAGQGIKCPKCLKDCIYN